jgi:hypothetical protein
MIRRVIRTIKPMNRRANIVWSPLSFATITAVGKISAIIILRANDTKKP